MERLLQKGSSTEVDLVYFGSESVKTCQDGEPTRLTTLFFKTEWLNVINFLNHLMGLVMFHLSMFSVLAVQDVL